MLISFFSIVIPTYNQSNFLKKALQSVYSQTFKNFEVIVVDNNSNDKTHQVAKSFKKVIYKKINNRGVIAKSRNLGIKLSKGSWIAFLDSDDFWEKNKLNEVNKKIKKNNFDVVCHSEWSINLNSKEKKISTYGPYTENFYKKILIYGNRNSTSASVVNKKFLKKNKLKFNENKSFITAEDYNFFLDIAKLKGIFYYINKPLGYHVFHKKSMSFDIKKHTKARFAVLKHHVFKVQEFSKKTILFHKIKKVDQVKNSIINFKNDLYNINKLLSFIYFLLFQPNFTFIYLFFFVKKFLKQKINYLYYDYFKS